MRGRERNLGKDGKRKVEEREFEEKEEEKDLREGVGHLHVKKRGERWGKTGKEDDLGHRCSRDIGAYPGRGSGSPGHKPQSSLSATFFQRPENNWWASHGLESEAHSQTLTTLQ